MNYRDKLLTYLNQIVDLANRARYEIDPTRIPELLDKIADNHDAAMECLQRIAAGAK